MCGIVFGDCCVISVKYEVVDGEGSVGEFLLMYWCEVEYVCVEI